jgi:hypothetical protein
VFLDSLNPFDDGRRLPARPGVPAMTPVTLDADAATATLRLDRETFAALVAYAAQPTGATPYREDHGEGWVAGHAAGFLLPVQGKRCELVVVHPGFVPERLARTVGLGPRPRAPTARPVALGTGLLDELTAPDPGRRAGALQRVPDPGPEAALAVAHAIATGFRARWEVVMRWLPAPGSTGRRAMQVIDTETSLWAVEPADTGLMVSPTTPTAVWRRFVTLLPGDDELG